MFTLVIGGSASGKSEYAEQQVMALPGRRWARRRRPAQRFG